MLKARILLVNPWIHDFAAHNFWARPLGLLHVAEFLSGFEVALSYVDCMDRSSQNEFGCGKYPARRIEKPPLLRDVPRYYKQYGIGSDEFSSRLKSALPFDVVLVTSIMSYWYPGVQETIRRIRDAAGSVPVVLGGMYPTLYRDHALSGSGADAVYAGPLTPGLLSVLRQFGVALGAPRERQSRPELKFYSGSRFIPLLTSTGCPYHCTYCASRLLHSEYRRRPIDEVLDRIYEFSSRGIRDFAFYDDALLFDADRHIKPLLEAVVRKGTAVRFHAPNGLHARFIDRDLAWLMRRAGFTTIRLSLETTDPVRQQRTGGKIGNADFEKAVRLLQAQGFTKRQVGAYLMYGLPGQDLAEVKDGVRFLQDLNVTIHLAEFSPIKGTEAWNYLVRKGIIPDDLDPLFTNNTVFSSLYSRYDGAEAGKMKIAVKEYNHFGNF